jgi:hypothetical protein
VRYFHSGGFLLYYGDAQAHLNIARRIADSRTPGYYQFGTVWLPLPHAVLAPFAGDDSLWRSGLAGAIPSATAFTLAAVLIYLAVHRATSCSLASFAALAVFLSNPNALYLQSLAMTESLFWFALAGLLYFSLIAGERDSVPAAIAAAVFSAAASLTRYEGWFLVPFASLYLLRAKRKSLAVLFAAAASLAPLYWLAHNFYFWSDPLEFYRGPWSAKAIYQRALDAGMQPYPGDHNWVQAISYFTAAAQLACGWPTLFLSAAGVCAAIFQRRIWPVLLLMLPPLFYILSLYSSGTPIFVPHLWPNTHYNTRYGLALLPLASVACGFLAALKPRFLAPILILAPVLFWLSPATLNRAVTWKESQINSEARRQWTSQAASYLKQHYKGGGIAAGFGDLTAIFPAAGIPLREILHEGNEPYWQGAISRPDLFLKEEWAITFSGDPLATAILRADRIAEAGRHSVRYTRVYVVHVKGAPVVEIYRRGGSVLR